MTKISIKKSLTISDFEGDEYIVNLDRHFEGYEEGDILIYGNPFGTLQKLPLQLNVAIRKDGTIIFRSWTFRADVLVRGYFHVDNICKNIVPTDDQINTVAGLFSGRLNYEGLRLSPGKSLLQLCPFDPKNEEKKLIKKYF